MKLINKFSMILTVVASFVIVSCDKNKTEDNFDTSGTFIQNDQMARPAINTVFVGAARKNEFNTTLIVLIARRLFVY